MEREIVVRGTGELRALPNQAVDGVLARHTNEIARSTVTSLCIFDAAGGPEREIDPGLE